ncbi:hypothetical protein K9L97_00295 [Candidatus Woesearchaeota archaeon]|nr:hypothetical protein [Candidatus Woesearchaeota archaeon]
MELKQIQETKSALPRKELKYELKYNETTPSRKQLQQSISTKQKSKPELTIIKKIMPTYGEKTAEVTALIYENEEAMKAIEYPKVIEKNIPKKEEAKDNEQKSDSQPTEKKEGEQ